ncbi:MAG: DUF1328 domain-containing protein [Armatimonadota bacterium]
MLRVALVELVVAVVAGIVAVSVDGALATTYARLLFVVFLGLSLITFLMHWSRDETGREGRE